MVVRSVLMHMCLLHGTSLLAIIDGFPPQMAILIHVGPLSQTFTLCVASNSPTPHFTFYVITSLSQTPSYYLTFLYYAIQLSILSSCHDALTGLETTFFFFPDIHR